MYTALDLGCGQGGTGLGIHRAGYRVVGVDIVPQPRYPFEFHQADMLEWPLEGYDVIFVAPPCQRWSKQLRCRPGLRETYPDLITPMRPRLRASGIPYVIENVEGAPLIDPLVLCSAMFGKEMYRHRLFETGNGLTVPQPAHPAHLVRASKAGHVLFHVRPRGADVEGPRGHGD